MLFKSKVMPINLLGNVRKTYLFSWQNRPWGQGEVGGLKSTHGINTPSSENLGGRRFLNNVATLRKSLWEEIQC